MCDTGVPSLIVIGTVINQLETKVSLKTICCLRLFVVVYKHVMFPHISPSPSHLKISISIHVPACMILTAGQYLIMILKVKNVLKVTKSVCSLYIL